MLCSCIVKQNVSSDPLPVLCHLDVTRPPQQHVCQTTRNICAINAGLQSCVISTLDRPTTDQLKDQLHTLLYRHAPAIQCNDSPRCTMLSLCSYMPCRNGTLRGGQWLRSQLTVHKQILNAVKHKITRLVANAKTVFYSPKIIVSTTCKELIFSVTNRLMNKTNRTELPSSVCIGFTLFTVFQDQI